MKEDILRMVIDNETLSVGDQIEWVDTIYNVKLVSEIVEIDNYKHENETFLDLKIKTIFVSKDHPLATKAFPIGQVEHVTLLEKRIQKHDEI